MISGNHDTYASFVQSIDIDVESMERDRRLHCLLASELHEESLNAK